MQGGTGGIEIGILKRWFLLDQNPKITFFNSQETTDFLLFWHGIIFFFFPLRTNPLCIEIGLPESFARIALYARLGVGGEGGLVSLILFPVFKKFTS